MEYKVSPFDTRYTSFCASVCSQAFCTGALAKSLPQPTKMLLKKNKTIIEDDAFIGSNTSLVAPVRIGKKAVVGASSVITHNVKSGSLALTRAKQTELKNYKRKK